MADGLLSEFETATGGIWRIGGVCDYWAKPALAGRVAASATATDLIATLQAAITAAEELLGHPLIADVDEAVDSVGVEGDRGGAVPVDPGGVEQRGAFEQSPALGFVGGSECRAVHWAAIWAGCSGGWRGRGPGGASVRDL